MHLLGVDKCVQWWTKPWYSPQRLVTAIASLVMGRSNVINRPKVERGVRALAQREWDVVVIGGGNAAAIAAIEVDATGASAVVLERAPEFDRGGNSKHTRNVRCVHTWSDDYSTGKYTYDDLWRDLCGVGTGPSNEELASLTVRASEETYPWMAAHGVRWQRPLTGTLHLNRTNRFFLGGGKALVNTYYRKLAQRDVPIAYDAFARDVVIEGDRCTAVVVESNGSLYTLRCKAVVCASGGFEANLEWLREYWGDAVDNYVIRGPKYNDGAILRRLYELGAESAGEPKQFHAVAVDARSPRFDGGIATRLDTIPFGIVLNEELHRFYDEGEDIWPKRYAIWGRNIANQSGQIAYSLWDSKVADLFFTSLYSPVKANTLEGVARGLGVDEHRVVSEVRRFNAAVEPGGVFSPRELDACHTKNLTPPKTHWAQPLDTPPFYGIALRPGITFTYMGVEVNRRGQVVRVDGTPFENVFAAGEIMSGNVLSSGYLAGFGLTIGSVWGRIAGQEAARVAIR